MIELNKSISHFIESQFPAFYREEAPVFVEFVKSYFEWLEDTGNITNITRSLVDYRDIDNTLDDYIEHFKYQLANSIPFETLKANKKLFLKHIVDLYRSKGTERGGEILLRALYNPRVVSYYYPGVDVLKPSHGTWTEPRYIEVSNIGDLSGYVGKKIEGVISKSTAMVENYTQRRISNKIIDVFELSSIQGNFAYGETVKIFETDTTTDLPRVMGSLTAMSINDGGYGFSIGDILDINGRGEKGKGKVVGLTTLNGKVAFRLIDGGTGYSTNTDISQVNIYTRVALTLTGGTGNIQDDQLIYTGNPPSINASGIIVDGNTSYVTLKQINGGFGVGNTVKTAIKLTVVKSPSSQTNNMIVGDRVYQEFGGSNTAEGDIISIPAGYANTIVYVGNVTGSFSTDYTLNQVANSITLDVYEVVGGSNTGTATIDRIVGGGSGASFSIGAIFNTENIDIGTDYIRDYVGMDLANTDYGFPPGGAEDQNTILQDALTFQSVEVGTIRYLSNISPGTDYSSSPYVEVVSPFIAGLGIIEDDSTLKGNNAVVSAKAGIQTGIVSAVEILDSGFGYEPGEILTLTASNTDVQVTGYSIVKNQGKQQGFWRTTDGFISSNKYIHDSYYYQEYSYEVNVALNFNTYKDIIKALIHPIGTALFGRYVFKEDQINIDRGYVESSIVQE